MKRLSFIILLLSTVLMANALDVQLQNINKIKKSKAFLYSDMTMKTCEEATSLAYEQIQMEILSWAKKRSKKNIDSVPSKELNKVVDTIMVRRADMYRVVAYVRKSKLVRVFPNWKLTLIKELDMDDEYEDETIFEEIDTIARVRDSIPEANLNPEQLFRPNVSPNDVPRLLRRFNQRNGGGVLRHIMNAKNFFELREIMEPLKEKGDIIGYGKYATADKPEDCYLIVYDPAGNIKAFLGKGKEVRQNLKTGKNDSIKNYHGCGAIWFKIKD